MGNALGNTVDELLGLLRKLPPGTLVPVDSLLPALAPHSAESSEARALASGPGAITLDRRGQHPSSATALPRDSWRERLWTAPPECRIGRVELLEAVGRPKSWLYRHTKAKANDRIPHRKLDGELVFVVGEIREWVREHEGIIQAGPTDGDRRLRVAK